MKGPLWLVILHPATLREEYLEDVNIPFDVDLVTLQRVDERMIAIHEAYRVSKDRPLKVLHFGNWTLENGLLSPSHVSLYYRRKDLEGISMKVAASEVGFKMFV